MDNLSTAEHFLKMKGITGVQANTISIWMVEFAKLYVAQALVEASKKATIKVKSELKGIEKNHAEYKGVNNSEFEIDKDSIINAYNLENIK